MKPRPAGVAIFAILFLLNACFYIYLSTLGFFARGKLLSFLGASTSPAGVGPSGLLRLGNLLPFYFLLMAAVMTALGFGMWRLKNWARIVTMIIVGLSVLDAAFLLFKGFSNFVAADFARLFFALVICLIVLWYLSSKTVGAAFAGDLRS